MVRNVQWFYPSTDMKPGLSPTAVTSVAVIDGGEMGGTLVPSVVIQTLCKTPAPSWR